MSRTCFFYVEGADDARGARDVVVAACRRFVGGERFAGRLWSVDDVHDEDTVVGLNYEYQAEAAGTFDEVLRILAFVKQLSVETRVPFVVGVDGEDRDVIGGGKEYPLPDTARFLLA